MGDRSFPSATSHCIMYITLTSYKHSLKLLWQCLVLLWCPLIVKNDPSLQPRLLSVWLNSWMAINPWPCGHNASAIVISTSAYITIDFILLSMMILHTCLSTLGSRDPTSICYTVRSLEVWNVTSIASISQQWSNSSTRVFINDAVSWRRGRTTATYLISVLSLMHAFT